MIETTSGVRKVFANPVSRFMTGIMLAVLLSGANRAIAESVYVKPSDVAWEKILTGPPAVGSDEYKTEIDKLLEWQSKRTETDIARCRLEETVSPFIFSEVLGDNFTAKSLPVTAQLLGDVQKDIKPITKMVKAKWARLRPPVVDSRIHPCVKLEENGSYPSAHATRGIVWASILSEIYPDKKTELMDRGRLMGMDRVIGGIHFPSDVVAGQKLGDAIFQKLMSDEHFKADLDQAKKECLKNLVKSMGK